MHSKARETISTLLITILHIVCHLGIQPLTLLDPLLNLLLQLATTYFVMVTR